MRRRLKFDDRAVATMRRMAADRYGSRAIAQAVGSTQGSVKVMCSKLGIRLPRGRGRVLGLRLVAHVQPGTMAKIKAEAGLTGVSVERFATMVWEAIAAQGLQSSIIELIKRAGDGK